LSSIHGHSLAVFRYIGYFGHPAFIALCLGSSLVSNLTFIGVTLWLSVWVNAYTRDDAINIGFYLGVYTAISVGEVLADSIVVLAYTRGAWAAASRLHQMFIDAVLHAPLNWFRNVPVGRIVNRVSRDMMALDNSISKMLMQGVEEAVKLLFSVVAVSSILPVFLLPALFLSCVGILAGEVYTRTSVIVKKLFASSASPVFSQFSDTLAGLPVIRARERMADKFQTRLAERLRDYSQAMAASFSTYSTARLGAWHLLPHGVC